MKIESLKQTMTDCDRRTLSLLELLSEPKSNEMTMKKQLSKLQVIL